MTVFWCNNDSKKADQLYLASDILKEAYLIQTKKWWRSIVMHYGFWYQCAALYLKQWNIIIM